MNALLEKLGREYARLFEDRAWIVRCSIGVIGAAALYALIRGLFGRPGAAPDPTGLSGLIGIPYIDGPILLLALFSVISFFVPRTLPRGLLLLVLILVPFVLTLVAGLRAAW